MKIYKYKYKSTSTQLPYKCSSFFKALRPVSRLMYRLESLKLQLDIRGSCEQQRRCQGNLKLLTNLPSVWGS